MKWYVSNPLPPSLSHILHLSRPGHSPYRICVTLHYLSYQIKSLPTSFLSIHHDSYGLILVILSYCNFSQVLRLCFSLPHKYDQPYPFTSFLIHYPFFYGFDSLYISHFPIPPFPIVLSLNIHTLFYPLHHTLFVYSHSHT